MRALTDWRFVLALSLLIANDRVLKQAWPGFVTGKLSDVVGPVVAAVLGAVLLGALVQFVDARRATDRPTEPPVVHLSMAAVAALMTAINTSATAATAVASGLAITGWSQAIVVDPSDLVGLVALIAVPGIVNDPAPVTESPVAKTLALGAGAMACMATSAVENPRYDAIATDGDRVVVVVDSRGVDLDGGVSDDEYADSIGRLRSEDGGQTWDYVAFPDGRALPGPLEQATSRCLSRTPSVCIRSSRGLSIEESLDGGETWTTVYEIEEGAHLARFTNGSFADLSQNASAVSELRDGSVVVVMGQLEPAVRSADGTWSPSPGRYRSPGGAVMFFVVLGTAVAAGGAALIGIHRPGFGVPVVLATLPTMALVWVLWFVNDTIGVLVLPIGLASLITTGAAAIVFVIAIVSRNRKRPIVPGALLAMLGGPAAAGLVALVPLVFWRVGLTEASFTAALVFAVASAGVIGVGVLTRRLGGPPPTPDPPRIPPAPMRRHPLAAQPPRRFTDPPLPPGARPPSGG